MHNMDISRVIIRPYLTEKTRIFNESDPQKIALIVDPKANKHLVAHAFEMIYGIAPSNINIQTRKPVRTRTGTLKPGFTKLTKIAYITLPKGKRIATEEEETKETEKPKNTEAINKAKAKGQLKEVSKPIANQTAEKPKTVIQKHQGK